MNEREQALTESLKRCQFLEEKAQALRQTIEATEAKIAVGRSPAGEVGVGWA